MVLHMQWKNQKRDVVEVKTNGKARKQIQGWGRLVVGCIYCCVKVVD